MNKRATEADQRLKRLFDAIESGVADLNDTDLKERIATLRATRDQARVDAERAAASLESSGRKSITPDMLATFAQTARQRIRIEGGGYRRDHLRALAQRVEVADKEVRIIGSKARLFEVLSGKPGPGTRLGHVPGLVSKWCARQDSNLRPPA